MNEAIQPAIKKLSRSQKNFVRRAEQQGFEVEQYSGRGMYGEHCPAIKVDNLDDFDKHSSYYWDNLGMGYIIYCPN